MTTQITLTSQFELGYQTPPSAYCDLSLHLGFASDSMPQDTAHEDFKEFFADLLKVEFLVFRFRVHKATSGDYVAVFFASPTSLELIAFKPTGRSHAIDRWIEERSNGNWSAPAPGQASLKPDEDVDHHRVAASHLIEATTNWDAPLPQEAGLTRLGRLTSAMPIFPDRLIIVPWFGRGHKPNPAWLSEHYRIIAATSDPDTLDVVITDLEVGAMTEVEARTRSLRLVLPDLGNLVDEKSGFLRVNPRVRQLSTALVRLRQQSSSLLWTYPAVVGADDERLIPEKKDNEVANLKRAIWLGVTSLVTLLDPLLIALTMGGSQTREGPYVSALIGALEARNAEAPGTFSTTKANKFITDAIGELSKKSRADLSLILAKLFGLDVHGVLLPDTGFNNEPKLLPVILALYAKYTSATVGEVTLPTDKPPRLDLKIATDKFDSSLERQVIGELAPLVRFVEDKKAILDTLTGVLAAAGINAASIGDKLRGTTEPAPKADCEQALEAAMVKLADTCLDAIRQSVGLVMESRAILFANALAYSPPSPRDWDDRDLEAAFVKERWFTTRLKIPEAFPPQPPTPPPPPLPDPLPTPFADLAATLHVVDLDYLDTPAAEALLAQLEKSDKAVLDQLFPGKKVARFVPDTHPRDLPIQVAVDVDTADGDTFPLRFNGVGALVSRSGEQWAYANLATLALKYPPGTKEVVDRTIHPLQSVTIDGQRQLILNYSGLPFASRAFESTQLPDANSDPGDLDLFAKTFYGVDDPVFGSGSTDQRLPALSYGYDYSIAAHVITKGGSLPTTLQVDKSRPWVPTEKPKPPAPSVKFVWTERSERTTSIGRTGLLETPSASGNSRIGVGIDDCVPLSTDYPRLALACLDGLPAMLDVLRNADGTGSLALPATEDARFEAIIRDVWWWNDKAKLSIEFLNQPDAMPDATAGARLETEVKSPFAGGAIALQIAIEGKAPDLERVFRIGLAEKAGAPPVLEEVLRIKFDPDALTLAGTAPAWVRLRLQGQNAVLSLADPTAEILTDASTSRRVSASLVLLADPADKAWKPDLCEKVTARLTFPRVGFKDFDRWFSNKECQAIQFPKLASEDQDPWEARRLAFETKMMTGYIGRAADPGLAEAIEAMPDPAVAGLRLELIPLDGICKLPHDLVTSTAIPRPREISFLPLGDLLAELTKAGKLTADAGPYRILEALADVRAADVVKSCDNTGLRLEVDSSGGPAARPVIKVNVPPGMTARLSVQSMVPETYFRNGTDALQVLFKELIQLAIGHANGTYYFEGPSLTLEGMCSLPATVKDEEWVALVHADVHVVEAGQARTYDLTVRPTGTPDSRSVWMWRQAGSASIQTQRWRFMGRPIHNWIDPKGGKPWPGPARGIDIGTQDLAAFEREAFFDRDPIDGESRVQQLQPASHPTVLQAFPWNLPSATIFRHRVTVRSRYIGAMRSDSNSTRKGYSSDTPNAASTTPEDWIRGAILADRSRLQLTRPQLRALLPLTTTATERAADAVSPPVMAILEEHPFAHGGLADRISAEIRTGFGFSFEGGTVVHAADSRKEFGPDPRLSYFPTPAHRAWALTLDTEGPIGLTFDRPTVPAPAFANTAFLLRPRLPDAAPGLFEEHFLSVSLRRYLDHRWMPDNKINGTSAPVAEPWWVEFRGLTDIDVVAGGLAVMTIKNVKGTWIATTNSDAVDPVPNLHKLLQVAELPDKGNGGFALLHMPLEEGRASLTLFALPGAGTAKSADKLTADVASGDSDVPRVLASFEWKVPAGCTTLDAKQQVDWHAMAASPTTLMNWTRTGRSFDKIDAYRMDLTPDRLDISDLDAEPAGAADKMVFVQRSTNQAVHLWSRTERNPLFVHRHLAGIITSKAHGIGRPLEIFEKASRILGSLIPIDPKGRAALRLVTFETPARPLVLNPPAGSLADMTLATFDLKAILGDKYGKPENEPKGLSFVYRPLGRTNGDAALKDLSFKVECGSFVCATKIELAGGGGAPVHSVIFGVNGTSISWRVVFQDGSQIDGKDQAPLKIDISKEEVVIVTPSTSTLPKDEYWGDISMLTMAEGANLETFSWDWLFTGRDLDGAEAVTPLRLAEVAEAEARIISISAPIRLDD